MHFADQWHALLQRGLALVACKEKNTRRDSKVRRNRKLLPLKIRVVITNNIQ